MCRMLAVPGGSPEAQTLLMGFRQQARDARAGHPDGEAHPDGWGLVDASVDADFERAVGRTRGAQGFLLGHLRQASKGRIAVPNTHPFIASHWAFCHNGTIHGDLDIRGQSYEGDTDSERLFQRLLRAIEREGHVPTAIAATVKEVEATCRFSSLAFLLTDGQALYGYRHVGEAIEDCGSRECATESYGLGFGRIGATTFVAQEPTHLGALTSWQEVPDRHVFTWALHKEPQIRPLSTLEPMSTRPV
jgi:predicted glutamine amidotransferase